jgi:hypothetical protein
MLGYGRDLGGLLTGLAVRFVDEAREWFGLSGALARWPVGRGCRQASRGPIIAPEIRRQDYVEPEKHKEYQLINKRVECHCQASLCP